MDRTIVEIANDLTCKGFPRRTQFRRNPRVYPSTSTKILRMCPSTTRTRDATSTMAQAGTADTSYILPDNLDSTSSGSTELLSLLDPGALRAGALTRIAGDRHTPIGASRKAPVSRYPRLAYLASGTRSLRLNAPGARQRTVASAITSSP
ncbi:hypothetical protein BD626DRAFT_62399 [Schizophyllum amplum]|uniref:Uncharacterized protein n=1 Tax=Schizophyllum amplum TaxID=97359 RepID=A0A550BSK5_9AGAR|nr:hypothetical protein BD626DRAFT_62399 [Auriculariopsis ampla]